MEEKSIVMSLSIKPSMQETLKTSAKKMRCSVSAVTITGGEKAARSGDGWSVPPFGGVVKDGSVWGRGASDDKGPLAGLLAAADYLEHGRK